MGLVKTPEKRPVTIFTGQSADVPFEELVDKVVEFGYDGVELACWGDHFSVKNALEDTGYCKRRVDALRRRGLGVWAISNHLVGQAVCDDIDIRHKAILPPEIWGEGDPKAVKFRAAERMKETAKAAAILADAVGHQIVVNGFTGSSIWKYLYSFPPVTPEMIDAGYKDFADKWNPILDVFEKEKVKFALEAHPTEIAFDCCSAKRALEAIDNRESFGFNYDPSHFGYQGVDYIEFLRMFSDRIYHVHMKDVGWSSVPKLSGVFGGHLPFGDVNRFWDFRSLGRGNINFEEIIRMLNRIGYFGPLSVEWEDSGMDREHGAVEACDFVKAIDFAPSTTAFDAAFEKK